jgi:hypothetical protein
MQRKFPEKYMEGVAGPLHRALQTYTDQMLNATARDA